MYEKYESAKLVTIGKYGWTIYIDDNERVLGYCDNEDIIKDLKGKVTIIDMRSIQEDQLIKYVFSQGLPRFEGPYEDHKGGFSYISMDDYIAHAKKYGATVHPVRH